MSDTETKNAEAEAYIERVLTDTPEFLSDAHLVRIIGTLVTSYMEDTANATRLLATTLNVIDPYFGYVESGVRMVDEVLAADEHCMCDACVAHRKENSH